MSSRDERFYISRHAGKEIVFRNIMRKRAGGIEPMIQVEILDDSEPFPLIRCDKKPCIGLHLDMYNKDRVKVNSHRRLRSQTPREAIIEVIDMLEEKLPDLLLQLGFGYMVNELPNNWKFQLERAKEFLLAQVPHPERIVGKSGTVAVGYGVDAVLKSEKES